MRMQMQVHAFTQCPSQQLHAHPPHPLTCCSSCATSCCCSSSSLCCRRSTSSASGLWRSCSMRASRTAGHARSWCAWRSMLLRTGSTTRACVQGDRAHARGACALAQHSFLCGSARAHGRMALR